MSEPEGVLMWGVKYDNKAIIAAYEDRDDADKSRHEWSKSFFLSSPYTIVPVRVVEVEE